MLMMLLRQGSKRASQEYRCNWKCRPARLLGAGSLSICHDADAGASADFANDADADFANYVNADADAESD